MTLQDLHVFRDCLLANDDWNAARHAYAAEHDRYFPCLHRVTDWYESVRNLESMGKTLLLIENIVNQSDCPGKVREGVAIDQSQ
ncbi:MAG: hypothetical protein WA970_07345 [Gammaproteobacteria bacterium]